MYYIKALIEHGIKPEVEILHCHLLYFGPLPDVNLEQIDDDWHITLKMLSGLIEIDVAKHPG